MYNFLKQAVPARIPAEFQALVWYPLVFIQNLLADIKKNKDVDKLKRYAFGLIPLPDASRSLIATDWTI